MQKIGPRIANSLNMRASPRAAPFDVGSTPAEEQSFSEFAEVFATGPRGTSCQPAFANPVSVSDIPPTAQKDCNRHNDPVGEFLDSATKDLASVRDLLSQIGRTPDEAARQMALAYHWSEPQVWDLPLQRRLAYLMQLEADADAVLFAGLTGSDGPEAALT